MPTDADAAAKAATAGRRAGRLPIADPRQYAYDFGDTVGMAPLAMMYTLGHDFMPPGIHAGGLRYHGMAPIVSLLRAPGHPRCRGLSAERGLRGGRALRPDRGHLSRPRRRAHAIKAAIDEALRCKQTGQSKCIVPRKVCHK